MADSKTIEARKRTAVDFLQQVVAGDIEQAYQKYVDPQGKHHNAYFPAGFAPLKKAMIENHAQFPNKQITVKNVLGDGDLEHSRHLGDGAVGAGRGPDRHRGGREEESEDRGDRAGWAVRAVHGGPPVGATARTEERSATRPRPVLRSCAGAG